MDNKIEHSDAGNSNNSCDSNQSNQKEAFLRNVYYMRRRPWMILTKSIILLSIVWVFLLPYWGQIKPEFFLFFYIFVITSFFIYSLWGQWTFYCIKCSNRFFFPPHFYYNPFATKCQHCGHDPHQI